MDNFLGSVTALATRVFINVSVRGVQRPVRQAASTPDAERNRHLKSYSRRGKPSPQMARMASKHLLPGDRAKSSREGSAWEGAHWHLSCNPSTCLCDSP